MNVVWLYLISLPILALLDLAWIAGIAHEYYTSQLGTLLSNNPVWPAIIAFYILYAAGLVFFAVLPAVAVRSLARAILSGAFFGLVAYGTYDLTNLATTAGWPLVMSFVDMAWGALAGGLTSGIVFYIASTFLTL